MAVFGLFKKKKKELPLPPPPSPPELQPILKGDIEPIRAPEEAPEAPAEIPRPAFEVPERPVQRPLPEDLVDLEEEHEEPPLPEFPPALPSPEEKFRPAFEPTGEKEVRVFDKTIPAPEAEKPQVVEKVRPTPKPTFVAVEDYKRIINDTNTIRSKLMEAESFVRRLSDLKNEEERAFEKWRTQLEAVEKKLNYVDQLVAKAQQ